jgi:hypothetical protein
LAKSDLGNALWQRDLSVAHLKVASVLRKTGDERGARDALRYAQTIMIRLTAHSPENAEWKNYLLWLNDQLGELER